MREGRVICVEPRFCVNVPLIFGNPIVLPMSIGIAGVGGGEAAASECLTLKKLPYRFRGMETQTTEVGRSFPSVEDMLRQFFKMLGSELAISPDSARVVSSKPYWFRDLPETWLPQALNLIPADLRFLGSLDQFSGIVCQPSDVGDLVMAVGGDSRSLNRFMRTYDQEWEELEAGELAQRALLGASAAFAALEMASA